MLPLIVLVSLAGITAAHAQVAQGETLTYPDTRAGTIAQAWIDALNTGEADLMRTFEEAYRATTVPGERSIEERIARAQELHVRVGELQPHRILGEDAEHLAMLARAVASASVP